MAKKARPGNNGLDPQKVETFVKEIEEIDGDIARLTSEHMNRCKSKRGDRKVIIDAAGDAGINKKALKDAVAQRALERRARKIPDGLDPEAQEQLDLIRHALGDLADTELGHTAVAKASNVVSMPA